MFLDDIELTKEYIDEHLNEIKKYLAEAKRVNDWNEVKRVQTLIRTVDPTNRRVLVDLTAIAQKEGDLEEERKIHLERWKLDPNDINNVVGLYILAWKLRDLGLLEMAVNKFKELEPDSKKTKQSTRKLNQIRDKIRRGTILSWTDSKSFNDEELFSKTIPEDETGVSGLREQLYGGEISQEKFLELVDSYSDSTQGIIFLAEGCMYFKKPLSAQKALNGYRKSHQSIQVSELKAINQAMEIVKSKQRIVDPEKWKRIYVALNKALQELDER